MTRKKQAPKEFVLIRFYGKQKSECPEIKKEKAKIPKPVRDELKHRLASLEKQMNSDSYKKTLDDIDDLGNKLYKAQRDYTFAKATSDETYYYLDEERTAHQDTSKRA